MSPAFARAVSAAFDEMMLTSTSIGGVRSSVTTLPSVVESAAAPALLAMSAYSIRIVVAPSDTWFATNHQNFGFRSRIN